MKSKKIINILNLGAMSLSLSFLSIMSYGQACEGMQTRVCLKNVTQPSPNTLEMDVIVQNTGTTDIGLTALPGGFTYPEGMIPAGATLTGKISTGETFKVLNNPSNGSVKHESNTRQIRWAHSPKQGVSVNITKSKIGEEAKEYEVAHIVLSLNQPFEWPANFACDLKLNYGLPVQYSNTATTIYCNGNKNASNLSSTKSGSMSVCNPPTIILNPQSAVTSMSASAKSFNIFPNPTNDIVNIEFEAEKESKGMIKVYDMAGKLMKQIQMNTQVGLNQVDFSLAEMAQGMYNIQIFENEKMIHASKIQKNN